jgi:hypothetical protein
MASDHELEVYRAHRTAQEKYSYFMLAAAGAAIGFSVTRTQGLVLSWSQIPLAAAVICWGFSFFCGCMNLRYVESNLYANMSLLKVISGKHPDVGNHPQMMQAASEGIRSAMESNSNRTTFYGRWQFYLMMLGAVSFVGWDVYEMYLRMPHPE